jgi:hypothetical protein
MGGFYQEKVKHKEHEEGTKKSFFVFLRDPLCPLCLRLCSKNSHLFPNLFTISSQDKEILGA